MSRQSACGTGRRPVTQARRRLRRRKPDTTFPGGSLGPEASLVMRSVFRSAGRAMSLHRSVGRAALIAVLLLLVSGGLSSRASAASDPPLGNANLEPNTDTDLAGAP